MDIKQPVFVPLHKYPDMLSTTHVCQLLGCRREQARRIMETMDHIDISLGAGKQRTMRVPKEDIARRYNLKQSIYSMRGNKRGG